MTVTFSGNTAGLADPTSPAVNTFNTGGRIPPERSLYIGTDYADNSNPQVTVFFDFDHVNGVGILRFNIFDLDGAGTFIDRVQVTACRDANDIVCNEIKPTLLTAGPVNQVTPPQPPATQPDTITGLLNAGSPFDSDAGNAEFQIDQVSIRRLKVVYSNVIGAGNPGFQAISIHDVSFIPTNIADLSLDKSVNDAHPPVGSRIVFTVNVHNEGPSGGTGIEATDLLPSGFTYVSDDGNGAYDPATGVWTVGNLPVNATATLHITVDVNAQGDYTNVAEITRSEQADPDSTPGGGPVTEDDYDSVTVIPIGANVPIAVDDFSATGIDMPVNIPVLDNDTTNEPPLQIVSIEDPPHGTAVLDDNGTPGTADDFVVYTPDAGFTGIETFDYTIRDISGQTSTATVTVLVGPVFLHLTKTASPQQVLPGGLVQYTVTIENVGTVDIASIDLRDLIPGGFTYVDGSARLDGATTGFTVSGQRPVVFEDLSFDAGQTRVLTYMVRVGAGVAHGEFTNLIAPTPAIGNEASATVAVVTDPDFEQTTIIGKVFYDRDADGWQDEGEEGIPGVRLGTVEGLLVETDQYGRYHIAGVDGGFADRGRNYIIKVDPQTLPPGSVFTTENPRVLRITQGLMNRIDFGVRPASAEACCQQIEVKLAEMFFKEGSDEIEAEYFPALSDLAQRLREHGGGLLTIEGSAMRGPPHVEPTLTQEAKDYVLTPHFDVRKDQLSTADKADLDRIVAEWRGLLDIRVEAVGHTDSTRIAPEHRDEFADNYALSHARANTVASYLRTGLGLDPSQVSADGRGPDQPVASNATAEGRAANRRVELRISGRKVGTQAPTTTAGPAVYDRDLADRRAQRVYQALRRMLGEQIMRKVEFQISWAEPASDAAPAAPESQTPAPERTSDARSLPRALLDLLVAPAYADEAEVQDCTVSECQSDDGYAVRILSHTQPMGRKPGDTHYASDGADRAERVNISGRFAAKLPGGGDIWANEDPTLVQPRLALDAPQLLPVADGHITQVGRFYAYSNYPAMIARAELIVYRLQDTDRVTPLAVVPIAQLQGFTRIDWDGAANAPLAEGDHLAVVLRVYDGEGRFDETRAAEVALSDAVSYKAPPRTALVRALGSDEGDDASRAGWRGNRSAPPGGTASALSSATAGGDGGVAATPLHGNVMVFRPHEIETRLDTQVYTLTPRFDTLKTELHAQDRAELDRIAKEWATATEVRIEAVGHTDNVRIAPEHRHLFKDNYELSQARAWSVVNYLKDKLGVTVSKVNASGRGPDQPVASNRTEIGGRELNRRVELHVTGMRPVERIIEEPQVKLVDAPSGLESDIDYSLEEAENVLQARKDNAALRGAAPPSAAAAPPSAGAQALGDARFPGGFSAQESSEALTRIYGTSQLALQTIPLRASLVRIHGIDPQGHHSLYIDGDPVPLDREGKFAVEYLMPIGTHSFKVDRTDAFGQVDDHTELPVELTGKYMFLVGLADFTVSGNHFSGAMEPVAGDERFDEDFLVDGRLAFYLKGKVKGKYLLTAQLDSQEEQLDNLLGRLDDKDPRSVFRRLDPDRYYPVYGDDSTTVSDTDSQGRFYLRLDWDRSQALWGNFNTGFTGTEFAQYSRSLYGAKYHHQSTNVTAHGEPRSEGQVFVSQVQTALGHSEFSGTGGSVYYLRHRDILPGSDKAHVEVLDRDSLRVIDNVTLQRGLDYEIDELQGRIILARPLAQISPLVGTDLIKDSPLDGNTVRLLVDYEYVPDGFSADKVAYGGRGRYWVNDHVAIGGTLVDENRDAADYQLEGGDVVLRAGRGSYLKLEYAQSDSTQGERFLSSDGGLSFADPGNPDPQRSGAASGVEARVNTREWLGTQHEWIGSAWYRQTDADFSVARRDLGVDTDEYGVQVTGAIGDRVSLAGTAAVVERGGDLKDQRLSLQADYHVTTRSTRIGRGAAGEPGSDAARRRGRQPARPALHLQAHAQRRSLRRRTDGAEQR